MATNFTLAALVGALVVLLGAQWCTSDKPDAHNPDVADTKDERATKEKDSEENPTNYYNPPFDPANPPEPLYSKSGTRLVTLNELAAHGSINGTLRPYWLAILGRVYDVDKGDQYYGPKGGYNFFTGCDGSKAFITGDFTDNGLTDDISELSPTQLIELTDWAEFYNKDYNYVGKLIGRFYDKGGSPTKEFYKYQRGLKEGELVKKERESQEKAFPPCNSRYTPSEGSIVSCSTKSGGIERDWEGLPRRYFAPGNKDWRCACVHDKDLDNPHVKLYPGCAPTAKQCSVDKNKLRQEL